MYAMVLDAPGRPVELRHLPRPQPGPDELLVKIAACAVCRTDLHVVDGELAEPKRPLIPGHEIVGKVASLGRDVRNFAVRERVGGIPWLGWTCGVCRYCRSGYENLCPAARFTGSIDGGYAEYTVADARYCFPAFYSDVEAAPLLCAGFIGYRALKMAGDGGRVGIYGFGAAAHIVAQILNHQGRKLFAFTRPNDIAAQDFAREMGAAWAGNSDLPPPEELDAVIIFAPIVPQIPIRVKTESFPLSCANTALTRLREGKLTGVAVLVPGLDLQV